MTKLRHKQEQPEPNVVKTVRTNLIKCYLRVRGDDPLRKRTANLHEAMQWLMPSGMAPKCSHMVLVSEATGQIQFPILMNEMFDGAGNGIMMVTKPDPAYWKKYWRPEYDSLCRRYGAAGVAHIPCIKNVIGIDGMLPLSKTKTILDVLDEYQYQTTFQSRSYPLSKFVPVPSGYYIVSDRLSVGLESYLMENKHFMILHPDLVVRSEPLRLFRVKSPGSVPIPADSVSVLDLGPDIWDGAVRFDAGLNYMIAMCVETIRWGEADLELRLRSGSIVQKLRVVTAVHSST